MTNKEALLAVVQVANIPDNSLVKALMDAEILDTDEYEINLADDIDLVAIDVLQGLLSQPDIQEGGYKITFDRAAIAKRLGFLADKQDVVITGGPIVQAKNPW